MNTKTDSSPTPDAGGSTAQLPAKKPRLAIFIATAGGLGYFPKAPGTLGSLVGPLLAVLPWWTLVALGFVSNDRHLLAAKNANGIAIDPIMQLQIWMALTVGLLGVWGASRAATYWSEKDPQRVVIDEVSGQHLALVLGCAVPVWWRAPSPWPTTDLGFVTTQTALTWKYLLLGFILFRLFDIWKPFPARQAESLSGGWGIMTDDWVAGIYAGIGLWLARAAGL
jgi:phosphatidylglycerophosphatase A